jgi:predicted kinase
MTEAHAPPLLVLVGGAPGSGKTTLARRLAADLDVPWLSRDPFSRGIRLTEGSFPGPQRSWAIWYETLASLLNHSVSLVADQTLYRGVCESDIESYLLGKCRPRFIHCRSVNAFERFKERERQRIGEDSDEYRRVLKVAEDAGSLIEGLPDLDVETLTVETDDGYRPTFSAIVDFCLSVPGEPLHPVSSAKRV